MRAFVKCILFLFVLLFFNGVKNIEASTTETPNEVAHISTLLRNSDHPTSFNTNDTKPETIQQKIVEMNKKNQSFVLIAKNNQLNFEFSIKNRTQLSSFLLQEYFLLKQHINRNIRVFLYNIVCKNIHINEVVEYYIFSLRKILI